MATYTLTTTAAEEAAITAVVDRHNAQKLLEDKTYVAKTVTQYINWLFHNNVLASYVRMEADTQKTNVASAYDSASAATKNQIKSLLGL